MKTLILGLGNPILSDDGFGFSVARALERQLDRPDVTVMPGSVAGLDFLDLLTGYDKAIIIDAVQTRKGKAGTIYRLEPEDFAPTRHESTPHHINFATVLELGKRLGIPLPHQIVIFAVEAKDMTTFSEKCTPKIERLISEVTELVLREVNGG